MGLGKTVQTVSLVRMAKERYGAQGPALVFEAAPWVEGASAESAGRRRERERERESDGEHFGAEQD